MTTVALIGTRTPDQRLIISMSIWDVEHTGQVPDTYALAMTRPFDPTDCDKMWTCFEYVATHVYKELQ